MMLLKYAAFSKSHFQLKFHTNCHINCMAEHRLVHTYQSNAIHQQPYVFAIPIPTTHVRCVVYCFLDVYIMSYTKLNNKNLLVICNDSVQYAMFDTQTLQYSP